MCSGCFCIMDVNYWSVAICCASIHTCFLLRTVFVCLCDYLAFVWLRACVDLFGFALLIRARSLPVRCKLAKHCLIDCGSLSMVDYLNAYMIVGCWTENFVAWPVVFVPLSMVVSQICWCLVWLCAWTSVVVCLSIFLWLVHLLAYVYWLCGVNYWQTGWWLCFNRWWKTNIKPPPHP